ncbi:glycosyltransferase family 9 protein, partial [Candidatus Poribacteria bacterium]|nr:glycosyltransferase family 9 protein [Candidatus Poribacteria bacterium]
MLRTAIESVTLAASFLIQRTLYRRPLPVQFKSRRILVMKLDHLGDVLLATPVFSNLRHAYPDAQIHALVGSWGAAAIRNHPGVDEIIQYNAGFFCRSGRPTLLREVLQLFCKLRGQKYDLLIDLRGDWLTAIFALLKV